MTSPDWPARWREPWWCWEDWQILLLCSTCPLCRSACTEWWPLGGSEDHNLHARKHAQTPHLKYYQVLFDVAWNASPASSSWGCTSQRICPGQATPPAWSNRPISPSSSWGRWERHSLHSVYKCSLSKCMHLYIVQCICIIRLHKPVYSKLIPLSVHITLFTLFFQSHLFISIAQLYTRTAYCIVFIVRL